MATATLPRPPKTDEGKLWRQIDEIAAATTPLTTPDPNVELRAQLAADGATTILGIVPKTVFDALCAQFGLFRFDHPRWTSDLRLTVLASASYALRSVPVPPTAPRFLRGIAQRVMRLLPGGQQDPNTLVLQYLWPNGHDNLPVDQYPEDTQAVRVRLRVPLGTDFNAQRRTLERHGRKVGLAAVPSALAVDEKDARHVMVRRIDPIGFVPCQRSDGTEMVAILAQVGEFAPERQVIDWVRRHVTAAVAA